MNYLNTATWFPTTTCRSEPTARSAPARLITIADREPVSMSAVLTLVLWLSLLATGIIGFLLFYARPVPPAQDHAPILAQTIEVELAPEPALPMIPEIPLPATAEPPPLVPQLVAPPEAPVMLAVAEPTSAVAFALPVEGPVRVVSSSQAAYRRRPDPVVATPVLPPVQILTFGRGEGKQPAPHYPRRAIHEGQEGTVTIRFTVGETGRVVAAEPLSLSPWPLLNESALNAVRNRWQFRPGAPRLYEVAVRFQLAK